jgi:orotate phosphoribosyltransferase
MEDEVALKVAEFLLQIKAVKLQPAQPFTWASGWKSPIYCDNRIALSYPEIRNYICRSLVKKTEQEFGIPDVIAGVATAAIAQGVLVAEALKLPFVYVRPKAKDHGMENLIEGEIKAGQHVVVIEDLVSTGQSSIKAVQSLRDAGCIVKGMVCIFTYGFKTAEDNFEAADCRLVPLSTYDTLLKIAVEKNYVKASELDVLKEWRINPAGWKTTPTLL